MIAVQLIKVQFSAHSLQIHCIGLFRPKFFYFLGFGTKSGPYKINM